MKKLAILLLLTTAAYADNTDAFNNAYQIGKQNQFNLNLNGSSTFDSFGQANKFESNIINDANTGNATAQPMYNGATNDPNYLYNQGKADIASCQSKNDPRCTSLNKYGDKDTQTQFQAYNQGISSKYSIITKPDPVDSSCTQVIKKVPIGESTKTCIASAHQQSQCHSTISISLAYHDCDPNKNECSTWQSNQECKLISPYIEGKCLTWKFSYQHIANDWMICSMYNYDADAVCSAGSSTNITSCKDGMGSYPASYVVPCNGNNSIGGAKNWVCINKEPAKLATYACKVYIYSDGCKGFKQ